MDPGCPFAGKHTEFTSCRCEWHPHHKQSHEHDSSDDACTDRDHVWGGHWYSDMREWADLNKHAHGPDSPLACDSLSSVSTRESSFFSWNSEHSQATAAVTREPPSPEALSSRFSGLALFNQRIGHAEEISCGYGGARPLVCELYPDETVCQEDITVRDFARNTTTTRDLFDGWVSDSDEDQSCSSSRSRDSAKEQPIQQQAEDMPVGRQANHIPVSSLCIKGKPSTLARSRYSAAVKERFASSTLHGFLRFTEQGGSPCYSFFLDDSDVVLFARASRPERESNKENCDWNYSFHSKKDSGRAKASWKGRPKKESLASDLVGHMRVPEAGKAEKNRDGRVKEAHFVLYDGTTQQRGEGVSTRTTKQHTQPLKRGRDNNTAARGGHAKQRGEQCCTSTARESSCNLLHKEPTSSLRDSCMERNRTCISQQAELAAVVIRTSVREKRVIRRKEGKSPAKEMAGWGFKFLDKGSNHGRDSSFMEQPSHNASESEKILSRAVPDARKQLEHVSAESIRNDGYFPRPDITTKKPVKMSAGNRKSRLNVDVTVILPAGNHGRPTEEEEDVDGVSFCSGGPTPLLERWASGGDCACGGWDMGCGLSIFKAETLDLRTHTANMGLTRNDRMNWLTPRRPFRIFTQGYKQKKVLALEMVEAGLFSLSFQARLSPLQAFFIAVALFHQQMTDTARTFKSSTW